MILKRKPGIRKGGPCLLLVFVGQALGQAVVAEVSPGGWASVI